MGSELVQSGGAKVSQMLGAILSLFFTEATAGDNIGAMNAQMRDSAFIAQAAMESALSLGELAIVAPMPRHAAFVRGVVQRAITNVGVRTFRQRFTQASYPARSTSVHVFAARLIFTVFAVLLTLRGMM